MWLEQKGSETLSPLDCILPDRSWKLLAMHSKRNKHPVELLSTREMCSIVPVKDLHILVAGTEWVVEGGVGRIEARRPVKGMLARDVAEMQARDAGGTGTVAAGEKWLWRTEGGPRGNVH